MSIPKTARQSARITQLAADGITATASSHNGTQVIAAFERYLTTGKPSHLTRPLYDYLTTRAGFIAHHNIHHFRALYRDPADLLRATHEALPALQPHSPLAAVTVYQDAVTSREVGERLAELIKQHTPMVLAHSRRQRAAAEIATARELAQRNGLRLVPATEQSAA